MLDIRQQMSVQTLPLLLAMTQRTFRKVKIGHFSLQVQHRVAMASEGRQGIGTKRGSSSAGIPCDLTCQCCLGAPSAQAATLRVLTPTSWPVRSRYLRSSTRRSGMEQRLTTAGRQGTTCTGCRSRALSSCQRMTSSCRLPSTGSCIGLARGKGLVSCTHARTVEDTAPGTRACIHQVPRSQSDSWCSSSRRCWRSNLTPTISLPWFGACIASSWLPGDHSAEKRRLQRRATTEVMRCTDEITTGISTGIAFQGKRAARAYRVPAKARHGEGQGPELRQWQLQRWQLQNKESTAMATVRSWLGRNYVGCPLRGQVPQ